MRSCLNRANLHMELVMNQVFNSEDLQCQNDVVAQQRKDEK